MKGKCPKCGWETRELSEDEVLEVKRGAYRCSGTCQDASVPNMPGTFPPKLQLAELEDKKEDKKHGHH